MSDRHHAADAIVLTSPYDLFQLQNGMLLFREYHLSVKLKSELFNFIPSLRGVASEKPKSLHQPGTLWQHKQLLSPDSSG